LLLLAVVVGLSSGSSGGFDSDKVNVKFPVDMVKVNRVAQKVLVMLHKKCPDMFDGYFVVLVLVAFFEECKGCFLNPEVLSELHKFVAQYWKAV
jgi:hypothetical protein